MSHNYSFLSAGYLRAWFTVVNWPNLRSPGELSPITASHLPEDSSPDQGAFTSFLYSYQQQSSETLKIACANYPQIRLSPSLTPAQWYLD